MSDSNEVVTDQGLEKRNLDTPSSSGATLAKTRAFGARSPLDQA